MKNDEIKRRIDDEKKTLNQFFIEKNQDAYTAIFSETHTNNIFINSFDEELKAIYDLSSCWFCENQNPDVFYGCNSLKDCGDRYRNTRWFIQRIEQGMYDNQPEQIYEYIIESNITMSLIMLMINTYITKKEEVFFYLIDLFDSVNDMKRQFQLYLYNIDNNPEHKEMHLRFAKLYLEIGKIDKAIEVLQKLKNPDEEIKQLITGFQKMIGKANE